MGVTAEKVVADALSLPPALRVFVAETLISYFVSMVGDPFPSRKRYDPAFGVLP
ncbi:MAG TPA: hypothetical protein P5137_06980 [Candidatus Brocadiia bacterium]|nr:hypothetical protein [Candidatus Brocadiia bacterium]